MPAKRASRQTLYFWVPFAWFALAAFIGWLLSAALPSVVLHMKLANAVEVPARILKNERREIAVRAAVNKYGPMRPVVTHYHLELTFAYTWQGREYTSSRATTYPDPGDLKETVKAGYVPGVTVICYVDPDDPTLAVLDREVSWKPLAGTAMLALMTVAAVAVGMWQGVLLWKARWSRARTGFGEIPPSIGRKRIQSPDASPGRHEVSGPRHVRTRLERK